MIIRSEAMLLSKYIHTIIEVTRWQPTLPLSTVLKGPAASDGSGSRLMYFYTKNC